MKRSLLEELSSSHNVFSLYRLPKRTLGCAIITAAIADYRSTDEHAHASANRFLFPKSMAYKRHFDWAVAVAHGIDRKWLREELDKARSKWDLERGLARQRMRSVVKPPSPEPNSLAANYQEAMHG